MKTDPDEMTVAPDGRPMAEQPAWRQDFPIDWPQDHYVARREFTRFLALISLSFVVGQFWILALNFLRRRKGAPPLVKIAAADLPVGGVSRFFYPDANEPCLLIRLDEARYVAFNQKCTHLSCNVLPKPERGEFDCPCHEARFDLATGRPLAGPPRRALTRILVEKRNGALYAAGFDARAE